MNQSIILASSSKQRQTLFSALGIPYTVVAAEIDEKQIRDADPSVQAEKIARAKAEWVAERHQGIIVAGDTYVVSEKEIFEKPTTIDEAKRMLRKLSSSNGMAYSGFCYLDRNHNIDYSSTVTTSFTFREMSEDEIRAYVATFPVTTWSSAFSPAYLYGMTLIAKLNGSLTGFTHGLPTELLIPCLRRSGIDADPAAVHDQD